MKIIHIQQWQKTPPAADPIYGREGLDLETQSQFITAQEIKKYREYPLLLERRHISKTHEDERLGSKIANETFPKGLPNDFNELTPKQKFFLLTHGAAETLLYLGEITAIYKSIHEQIPYDNSCNEEKIYGVLEREAIECAKEAAIKHFKNLHGATVIIVFGRKHDLKYWCKQEGIELEVINTPINIISKQEAKESLSKKPAFFSPNPNTSSTIPIELQKALKDGGIENDYIKKVTRRIN